MKLFKYFLIFNLIILNFAYSAEVKALSDDEMIQLQVSRTLQRQKWLEKNKVADAFKEGQNSNREKGKIQFQLGLKNYSEADYKSAIKNFETAVMLQPENDAYYFEYAKSLYRLNYYKLSLSIFLMLEDNSEYLTKAMYYQGLIFLSLKNYDLALKKFKVLQDSTDEDIAVSSAFFAGQIYFSKSLFTEAKSSFEYVLDHSKDPQLDKSAEQYIEKINLQEQQAKQYAVRFKYSVYFGTSYDDNVLNISQQNLATSAKAYRFSYGGTASYSTINTAKENLAPTFTFSDIYSLNSNFKSDATVQSTDPLSLQFEIPYKSDFIYNTKSWSYKISPGVQMLYMTKDSTRRELVYNSILLNSYIMTSHLENLTTQYKFDISRDQSYLTAATTDDEQTAQKYTLTVSNIYLLEKANSQYLSLDISWLLNQADGINAAYNKYLVSLGYARKLSEKWIGYAKAEFFSLNYNKATSGRKDFASVGYFGASYAVSTSDSISVSLQYQSNQSNSESYKYNKMILSAIYTVSQF